MSKARTKDLNKTAQCDNYSVNPHSNIGSTKGKKKGPIILERLLQTGTKDINKTKQIPLGFLGLEYPLYKTALKVMVNISHQAILFMQMIISMASGTSACLHDSAILNL